MKKRLGFSLVEIATVLGVSSALLAIAIGLLHTLYQFQQGGHEQLRQRLALDRLSQQFREDVHAATRLAAAEVAAADGKKIPGWELQLAAGRKVRYRLEGEALVRAELEGDKPVAHERFMLPPGAKAEMKVRQDKTYPLAGLRITVAREPLGSVPPPVLWVEGVLGLDHRFALPAAGASKPPEGKK